MREQVLSKCVRDEDAPVNLEGCRPYGATSSNVSRRRGGSLALQLRLQLQRNRVADEVSALVAVVRPILEGVFYGLKAQVVADAGGHASIRLRTLPRLHRA